MVICLERGADLHMAQLMPLPLTVSCFSKIQIGFTFLYWLTWVVPDKGPLNECVCVLHSFIAFLCVVLKICSKYSNSIYWSVITCSVIVYIGWINSIIFSRYRVFCFRWSSKMSRPRKLNLLRYRQRFVIWVEKRPIFALRRLLKFTP